MDDALEKMSAVLTKWLTMLNEVITSRFFFFFVKRNISELACSRLSVSVVDQKAGGRRASLGERRRPRLILWSSLLTGSLEQVICEHTIYHLSIVIIAWILLSYRSGGKGTDSSPSPSLRDCRRLKTASLKKVFFFANL